MKMEIKQFGDGKWERKGSVERVNDCGNQVMILSDVPIIMTNKQYNNIIIRFLEIEKEPEKEYDKTISIPDASKNNSGALHGEELAEYLLKSTMSCEEIDSKIKESETLGIIMTISEVEKHSESMFDCLERWKKHRNWDSIKKALIDNEK
jgi:hypothetical protein